MTEQRDRAGGWKHAKISGHLNEAALAEELKTNLESQRRFLAAIHREDSPIQTVGVGGLHETDVESIFGNTKTKSKTDIFVILADGSKYNISIKKSLGGQVYLISGERFIEGYEKQYNCLIPAPVKRAISLFWGSAPDTKELIEKVGTCPAYEKRKNRLVGESLKKYDASLYQALPAWFAENMSFLIDFCFARGLAKNKEDWADLVWYKNELGENTVNDLFSIKEMKERLSQKAREETFYGTRMGGSTIQLPFGFVQWHSPTKKIPGCMQFHHSYAKIKA